MNETICIVGESGSGKTTISKLIEKELGFRNIQSFTTRKPRYDSETGHIFTTVKQYECNKANRLIVAETFFDGNYYWTTKGQFKGKTVYVVDPVGIKYLKENSNWKVIVIYLKSDEEERIKRMWKREALNGINGSLQNGFLQTREKIINRVEHDVEAFKIVQCDYAIDSNRSIEEVLEDVKSIIDSENSSIEPHRSKE